MERTASGADAPTGRVATDETVRLSDVVIVGAARRIIAEVGVEGLTMRRLSTELGVALGATYHHVANKHALMMLVARELYEEVEHPAPGDGDWADQIKTMIINTARVVGSCPGMAIYMMTHVDDVVPVGLNQAFVRVLQDAGFSDHSVEVVMSALYFYGVGISANVLPMRGTKTFENVDAETLFADGVDLLLAGARQLLDADLAAR